MFTWHLRSTFCILALLLVTRGMVMRAAEDKRSEKREAVVPSASLLENGSFEEGETVPRHWKPTTTKNGKAEWVDSESSSGRRALKMVVAERADGVEWTYGDIKRVKPNTPYTISARSKGNGKAGFFRLPLRRRQTAPGRAVGGAGMEEDFVHVQFRQRQRRRAHDRAC